MAIQMRRGKYAQFDPSRLLPGEWAVVVESDPSGAEGRSLYMCFAPGQVKRVATVEDMATIIANAEPEVSASIMKIATDTNSSISAAESKRVSAESSRVSAESARVSAENARKSAETARASAQSKNNSDQANNNELAKNGVRFQVLTSSQVVANTCKPNITGERGVVYLAPTAADENSSYVEWVCPSGTWERVSTVIDSGYKVVTDNASAASTIGSQGASGSTTEASTHPRVPATLYGLGQALSAFKSAISGMFAAKSHTHSAADVTSGTLPASRGGTGSTSLESARSAMGLGNTTGPVPVANGGTGATTATAAMSALGAAPLASPALTGTPTAPTAAAGTSTTQLATTGFVANAIAAQVGDVVFKWSSGWEGTSANNSELLEATATPGTGTAKAWPRGLYLITSACRMDYKSDGGAELAFRLHMTPSTGSAYDVIAGSFSSPTHGTRAMSWSGLLWLDAPFSGKVELYSIDWGTSPVLKADATWGPRSLDGKSTVRYVYVTRIV